MDFLTEFLTLGNRFNGVSLDYRRDGTDWPSPWRARIVANKNERTEYRLQAFGKSGPTAILSLLDLVKRMDTE